MQLNLAASLSELRRALDQVQGTESADAGLRAARRVILDHGMRALQIPGHPDLAGVLKSAASAHQTPERHAFAVLLVHALGVNGLIPARSAGDACRLIETSLPKVLIRAGHPFSGTTSERLQSLARLHLTIDRLMEPLEPTFPSQLKGLHAG